MAGSANRSHSGRYQRIPARTSKLYDLLGLSKTASSAEIGSAYRRFAKIHHPDKGGDPEKFKELKNACDVLLDPEKRAKYDRWGDVDHTPPYCSDQSSGLFDPRNVYRPARKTEDVVRNISVTLEQIYLGQTMKVGVEREVVDKAKAIGSCLQCGGAGVCVERTRVGGIGQEMQVTCQRCSGRGQIFELRKQREELEVNIPKGAPDGHRVVLRGKADEWPGSETGDAIFVLKQQEHTRFKRKRADLFVEQKISLVEALCGLGLELTHLDGRKLLLKTAPGDLVRPLAHGFDPLADSDGKLQWEVFEDCDCDSMVDVAQADVDEAETAKRLCETQLKDQGHVIGGFVIQDGKAHFKQAKREEVLAAKRPRDGATLHVLADPPASSKRHFVKAVPGAGMPTLKNPLLRGNLFLLLDIEFPEFLSPEYHSKIREALPPPLDDPIITDPFFEVCDIEDIDPVQSYNSNKANMATEGEACDEEEVVHLIEGKTPSGREQVQCSQQ